MMKSLFITVQVDEFPLKDVEELEAELRKVVEKYPRHRFTFGINDAFGPPLPKVETENVP